MLGSYKSWSEEAREEDLEEAKAEAGEGVWLSVKDGDDIQVRVLPSSDGKPIRIIWKHSWTDEAGQFTSAPCVYRMYDEPCDKCQESMMLRRSPDDEDQQMGFDMSAKKRGVIKVLVRKTGLVKLWEISYPMGKPSGRTMFEKVMRVATGPQGFDLSDPSPSGYDIIIGRTGKGRTDTTYDVQAVRSPSLLARTVEEFKAIRDMAEAIDIDLELSRFAKKADKSTSPKATRSATRKPAATRSVGDMVDTDGEEIDPDESELEAWGPEDDWRGDT